MALRSLSGTYKDLKRLDSLLNNNNGFLLILISLLIAIYHSIKSCLNEKHKCLTKSESFLFQLKVGVKTRKVGSNGKFFPKQAS